KDDIRKILSGRKAGSLPASGKTKSSEDTQAGSLLSDERPRVLFLDEIHRFNKAQQDFLLPYVENGELVLIGATTENPSFEIISAFIKSMRASKPDAAMYYLARMIESGEDPKFIARRMVIFASEDIGLAQPTALVVANEVFRAVETIGLPECVLNLAHGTAYLANAAKDRSAHDAYGEAMSDAKKFGNLPVPMSI